MERVLEIDETEDGLKLVISVRKPSYDVEEGVDLGRRRPGTLPSHNFHYSVVDNTDSSVLSGFQTVYCHLTGVVATMYISGVVTVYRSFIDRKP